MNVKVGLYNKKVSGNIFHQGNFGPIDFLPTFSSYHRAINLYFITWCHAYVIMIVLDHNVLPFFVFANSSIKVNLHCHTWCHGFVNNLNSNDPP